MRAEPKDKSAPGTRRARPTAINTTPPVAEPRTLSDYHRWHVSGAAYFFTIVTHQRRPIFADAAMITLLRSVIRVERTRRPFDILAAVVLPDHLHMIVSL